MIDQTLLRAKIKEKKERKRKFRTTLSATAKTRTCSYRLKPTTERCQT